MPATPQSLGMRIRRARKRARLSQEDLARAIGVSVRAIGDWENDRRKPRNSLGALEQVLGVSLDEDLPEPVLPQALVDEIERLLPSKADQGQVFEFIRLVRSGRLPRREADRADERRNRSAGLAG